MMRYLNGLLEMAGRAPDMGHVNEDGDDVEGYAVRDVELYGWVLAVEHLLGCYRAARGEGVIAGK